MQTMTPYSYDELRMMFRWELLKSREGSALSINVVNKLIEAFTDDVLAMWEMAGLSNRIDFQARINNYRDH